MDVLAGLARLVFLDEQVQLAGEVRRRDGCVRANHGLALVVDERVRVGRLDDQTRGDRQ